MFRSCLVDGLVDEARGRRVIELYLAAKPRGYLATLMHFRRLLALDLDRHTARVETATPLPAELHTSVQAGLAKVYGPGLSTSFADRPELIGGMRIQVGSDVYDGSVKARLAALEEQF